MDRVWKMLVVLVVGMLCSIPFPALASDTEVNFTSADGTQLAATLSMPEHLREPVPAVFFVHGSGAQTRDESTGPNPMFKLLADPLVEAGFAVLRYDKRGVGKSTSHNSSQDVVRQNFIDDEAAALAFLQKYPGIDHANTFALGFGEGAELVAGLAVTGVPLRGAIVLAPESLPMAVMMERKIAKDRDIKPAIVRLRMLPWFKSYDKIDPAKEYARVTIPLLVLQGSADAEVSAESIPQLRLASREHSKDATVMVLDGDNHLFMHLRPGQPSTGKEYTELHPLDPRVGEIISAWLKAHIR
ncbi:MAG: hypothetical protein NVSMB31_09140 [Vulcanimicrobiaceae bacterium]